MTTPDQTASTPLIDGSARSDHALLLAQLIAAAWIALTVWFGLHGDVFSCDLGMHAAAIGFAREAMGQGIWWPYVHELHMGWDNYALYCWPLFLLLSLCATLLDLLGAGDPDWSALVTAAVLACASLPVVGSWFGGRLARLLGRDERAMRWGGMIGAIAFLCIADDSYYGFGMATLTIGLIAQVVAWPLLLLCLGSWLPLLNAPPGGWLQDLRRCQPFALSASALFFAHPLSAIICGMLVGTAFIIHPRVRRPTLLAAACCLAMGSWVIALYVHHGAVGMPWPHEEHHYRTAWPFIAHYLLLVASRGHLLSLVPMALSVTALGRWLGAPTALRGLVWGSTLVLVLTLEPGLDVIGIPAHWYRAASLLLLLGGCGGAALLAHDLAPHCHRRRDRIALAGLGALLLLVLPPYAFPRRPQQPGEQADWAACIADIRALGLERVKSTDDGHDNARLAERHRIDLACGAHTVYASPAYQWAAIAARDLELHMFCLTYSLGIERREELIAVLRDHGVQGLLFHDKASTLPATGLVPGADIGSHHRHGRMNLVAFTDPRPLLEAVPSQLLLFTGPWDRSMRWAVSAAWVRHRAAGHEPRRLVLVDGDGPGFTLRSSTDDRLLGRLTHPGDFTTTFLEHGPNQRFSALAESVDRSCATLFATLPPAPPENAVPQPRLRRLADGMELTGLVPGRPYLLRESWSPHLVSTQGRILREASGQIVVMPGKESMRLYFRPFPPGYPLLLLLAAFAAAGGGWLRFSRDRS